MIGNYRVRVSEIESVAANIKRFRLAPVSDALPSFSAGAHVVVTIPAEGRAIRNPYSLIGSSSDPYYEITVLKTEPSRGGSRYLHEQIRVGDDLSVSSPVNLFPLSKRGRRHLLIAGGIGITPFVAMANFLASSGQQFQLHYAMRTAAHGAYAEMLSGTYSRNVFLYRDDKGEAIPLENLLKHQPLGTHLYVCGPEGMIKWVLETGKRSGWPVESLHAERFLSPQGGAPFSITLAESKRTLTVKEDQSVLEALEAAGIEPPFLCRGGACGQCETAVVSYDGELLHHDNFLTAEEKASGRKIMICVSRLKGRELIVKL